MKAPQACKNCSVRGYSPELCALHSKMLSEEGYQTAHQWLCEHCDGAVGKALAVGACAGALTSVVGLSAACLVGLKGLFETVLAAKVLAGGGVAGAMTGVAIKNGKNGKNGKGSNGSKKRKHFLPPIYLNER